MRDICLKAFFIIGKGKRNRQAVFPWFVSTLASSAAKSKNNENKRKLKKNGDLSHKTLFDTDNIPHILIMQAAHFTVIWDKRKKL